MARNYFKVFERLPGDGRAYIGAQQFFFFDDADGRSTDAAYESAHQSPMRDETPVSVWRQSANVSPIVPVVGINPDLRKTRAAKASFAVLDMRDSEPVASAIGGE